ncbi:carbohydrate binding domain-containing protein [Paenibacillus contaminans]|uniref:Dockerin domain-containing protein n=1 Tax=Paenibacillus contaminans TaxID=450362 RepID=A0A329MNW0_9BACL|nr:carbohydrate binding domain-containing protein [Paenibacillus contaminans]RAV21312.1 hypothetical protein DQG23_11695 [Paenibacillus contaminans]
MKKKSLAGFLIMLLVTVMFSGLGVAAQTPAKTNLIENPGFEQGLVGGTIPGWLPVRQGSATISNVVYQSGQYSLRVDDNGPTQNGGAYSIIIPAEPGDRFRGEAYVNVELGNATFYMQFVNSEGLHHSYATPWTSGTTSGQWVKAIVEGIMPEGAAGVRLMPYSGAVTSCICYFDDLSLEKVEELPALEQFGTVQTIPDAVLNKLGQSAIVGIGADGTPESYFFANGEPGTFYALDAMTGEKRFSQQVPGANIVWGMTFSPDGSVYFASSETGRLFRYSPSERKIADLGINPSGRFVWDIEATSDGRYLYGSVYPQAKIFEYDTQTKTFRDLGTMMQGKDYVRGIGVTDRFVYASLGTYDGTEPRFIVRYDRQTGNKMNIVVPSTDTFIYNVHAYGGKLFVISGSLYVLDEQTFEPVGEYSNGNLVSPPSPDHPDTIYFTSSNKVYSFNMDTDVSQEVGTLPPLGTTSGMRTLGWVQPTAGEFAGKSLLSGVTAFGESFLFDPVNGQSVKVNLEIEGAPVQTHSLKSGPDGKLYLGGYHSAISIYDPELRSFLVHQYHTGQADSMGFLNSKVYFGTYGGAQILEYDPALPWEYGVAAGYNPYRAYDIEEQDRVYVFESGDNRLFIGTIPDYGRLGGKLTIYDAVADSWKEYDNSELVYNQSITGLAYHDGKLYGSTSIAGGLGIEPTESQAKLFVWDVAGERKLFERTLDLPGHKPPMIGDLTIGPDGLVWGATGSAIFALDPVTLDVVKSRTLYSSILDNAGSWKPFELYFGEDGYIYSTIGNAITVIDPETLESNQLAPKANALALGKDGSAYYSLSGKDIYRIPVKLQSVSIATYEPALPLGGTAALGLEGVLANGKAANLVGASLRYVTSDPLVASIEGNGVVTALSLGEANIHAEVTLDGTTVVSEPVLVQVIAAGSPTEGTAPTLAMPNQSGNAGDEVLVPLSLVKDAADLTQIHAIEFDMTFDEAALKLAAPDAGSHIQINYVEAQNKYRVLIGSEANGSVPSVNLPAALGSFAFTIKAGLPYGSTTAINLSNIIVSNEFGVTQSLANATTTVTVQDTIAPTITLTASTTDFAETVAVSVAGDGTGSSIAEMKWAIGEKTLEEMRTVGTPLITPSFIAVKKGMYTVFVKDTVGNEAVKTIDIPNIVIKGDANDDGIVDLLDWQKLANYILLKETPTARQAFASWLNSGNTIDVGDWVLLANRLVAH